MLSNVPAGARYAVVARDSDVIAWAPDEVVMLAAMLHLAGALRCSPSLGLTVVRIEDSAPIWPWRTKGGRA